MRQIRLFVAINFSDQVKAKLGFLIKELRQLPSSMKWVDEPNFHLTIWFLGNVPETQVNTILTTLSSCVASIIPFKLDLDGIGVFQSIERPRVFWMGISGETGALVRLHRQVQEGLGQLGFKPERRRFSPHLTLARVRSPLGFPAVFERAKELVGKQGEFGTINVASIELMQSKLSSRGSKYSILSSIPLLEVDNGNPSAR
ncbi:MAG: RNA 2',3'-cyclic phosphodiesterase [Desulfotomaculaceae bacterium]|nr:RNA 2',3'-cyclic phosphodiesterase [Desulfotomaculaceae bacterium]